MRRGEIAGTIGSRSSVQQFVANGYGRLIAQIGGSESDVPQLSSMVKDEEGAGAHLAHPVAGRHRAPDCRARPAFRPIGLNALIETYKRAMNDKDLQARADKFGYPVDPAYGEEVLKIVKAALNQSDETRDSPGRSAEDAEGLSHTKRPAIGRAFSLVRPDQPREKLPRPGLKLFSSRNCFIAFSRPFSDP